jgi:hypothetical protein
MLASPLVVITTLFRPWFKDCMATVSEAPLLDGTTASPSIKTSERAT